MKIKILKFWNILALFMLLSSQGFAESIQNKMHSGVSHYKQQNYDTALKLFSQAREEHPDDPEIAYNMANSQYRNSNFKDAIKGFNHAASLSSDQSLREKSVYNTGNSYYQLGKLQQAIESYKKALKINPNDMDSKFNLEFVREQLQKQKENRQKSSEGPNSDLKEENQDSKNKNPQSEDQKNNNEQKEENESRGKEAGNEDNNSQSKNIKSSPQESKTTKAEENLMSPEEAERWLRTLREDPKLLSKIQSSNRGRNPPYLGKDW